MGSINLKISVCTINSKKSKLLIIILYKRLNIIIIKLFYKTFITNIEQHIQHIIERKSKLSCCWNSYNEYIILKLLISRGYKSFSYVVRIK